MTEKTGDIGAIFERYKIVVSRETVEKLSIYAELLLKWQKTINLVGATTLENFVTRHFIDSAQVFGYIHSPDKVRLADMGSGAGFPGMVLAIMGVKDVHLIEADIRKATFLREVSRESKTAVTVHDTRIESCRIPNIDIFTARALATLENLLGYARHLTTPGHPTEAFFLKGAKTEEEIENVKKDHILQIVTYDSVTDPEAKIVHVSNI